MGRRFRVGDRVILKRSVRGDITLLVESHEVNHFAYIVKFLPDLDDGAVLLDRHLYGLRFWNTDELELSRSKENDERPRKRQVKGVRKR